MSTQQLTYEGLLEVFRESDRRFNEKLEKQGAEFDRLMKNQAAEFDRRVQERDAEYAQRSKVTKKRSANSPVVWAESSSAWFQGTISLNNFKIWDT